MSIDFLGGWNVVTFSLKTKIFHHFFLTNVLYKKKIRNVTKYSSFKNKNVVAM